MLTSVLDHLTAFRPDDIDQDVLRTAYIARISDAGDTMLWKGSPEHVTASCFVFSKQLDHILLTFHKKGQFWVQFGGHLEQADDTLAASAIREAREESGIGALTLTGGPVDLDLHHLGPGFSCAAHWDIGFTAIAEPGAAHAVSDESKSVEWWPVNALPDNAPADLPRRVTRAQRALRDPQPVTDGS